MLLTVVVPAFNEQEAIPIFYKEITKEAEVLKNSRKDLDIEIVFVDDGSKDDSLNVIKSLRKEDRRVRFVSFSRNFGKESALFAGLEHARGDLIVTMTVSQA